MQDVLTTPVLAEPSRDGLPPMPPGPPHEERHFAEAGAGRDLVLGASQGIALPFALSAALVGAGAAPGVIVTAGLAAVVASSVAAGLGRWAEAREEAAHYALERRREEEESQLYPDRERWEVAAILHRYGVKGDVLRQSVEAIAADRRKWVDFMMRFELDLSEPDPHRAARSAALTVVAGIGAGLVPLLPFLVSGRPLVVSAVVTALALLVLGAVRAQAKGLSATGGALSALGVGAAAAAAAWFVGRLVA
ncbi:iron transporter [Roseomonas stagni]|uniref:Iron transporter n=1 Tax=Falsiroseomonas algicola TaxID=2716930 RepID=A0A6M1LIH9_9PROT|nr:VIT1/CCC1 transporter family protein [Falsiroseomonas algicola]NGM20148.1 iron transporter [Falsiroseomonas algicola]